jgi:hypothetical protein
VQASLSAMQASFAQFAESFLALTKVINCVICPNRWMDRSVGLDRSVARSIETNGRLVALTHCDQPLSPPQGTVQWELVMKPEYDFKGDPDAIMPARPFHREVSKGLAVFFVFVVDVYCVELGWAD